MRSEETLATFSRSRAAATAAALGIASDAKTKTEIHSSGMTQSLKLQLVHHLVLVANRGKAMKSSSLTRNTSKL